MDDYAAEGRSLARVDGKVIFIERTVPGDVVDVRLFKNKKDWAEGFPIQFHSYSADRVAPFCWWGVRLFAIALQDGPPSQRCARGRHAPAPLASPRHLARPAARDAAGFAGGIDQPAPGSAGRR